MDQLEIDPERDKLSLGIDADRQSDDRYDGARAYGKGNDERENAFKRSNTNEHVTVTVTDANHARLYYKTPSNGNFLSTTEKSFTSGATNGQYTVYAVDGLGQKAKSSLFITTTLRRQASCMTEARSQEKTVHIYPHKP